MLKKQNRFMTSLHIFFLMYFGLIRKCLWLRI